MNSNKPSITTLCLLFCSLLLISSCEGEGEGEGEPEESQQKIELTSFELETPETHAITLEGIPVLSQDINLGKIYFNWKTNAETRKFNYHVYFSANNILDEEDHLFGSSSCNTTGVPCYPIKQKYCEIKQNRWLQCLSNLPKTLDLYTYGNFPAEGLSGYLILKVCPWGEIEHPECNWKANELRIEPKCSQYKMFECLDEDPLEIDHLDIAYTSYDESGVVVLPNQFSGENKLWLSWSSSWITKHFRYKIEAVYNHEGTEYSETLVDAICNDHDTCSPVKTLLCKYRTNTNTGLLTCAGDARYIHINQIASPHPVQPVEIEIRLTAFDDENQTELVISNQIKIDGES